MAKQDLHFSITATNEDLIRKLRESRQAIIDSGKTAEATASRIDGSFKRMATSAAALGGGIAIGAMAKELYGFANAFGKSMLEVSTISDTVTENIDQFKQKVLELTTQIPISADVAGKALYQIVSAGYDGAAGMQLLEVSAKSAIAGMTDTTTAADAITTLLNAYKLSADDAANISDQLFMTAKLGKTTFGELGQSISQAAPIAAAYGVEVEQVLAAVATLTKSGTPTAQAMTQIRAAIIGVSKYLGDGAFNTMSFQEALDFVAKKANGSEEALRGMITEVEGVTGLLGLTGINAKMAASDLTALGGAAGETEKACHKMVVQADYQIDILKNNMLKKFHEIGEGGMNVMGGLAKALNTAFETGTIDDLIAIMGVLIATVGVYKAQLMVTNAVKLVGNNLIINEEIKAYQALLPVKEVSKNKDIELMVAKGQLSQATAERLVAIRAEVQAELESLRVKAQVLAAEATVAVQAHQNALRRSVVAKQNMALAQSQMQIAIQGGNADEIVAAKKAAQTVKLEMNSAAIASNTTRQALNTAQTNASSAATAVDTMQTNINAAATTGATKAKTLWAAATGRLTTAFKTLGAAIKNNPVGVFLTLITAIKTAMSLFTKEVDETALALKRADIETSAELTKLKSLEKILKDTTQPYQNRKQALNELQAIMPNYNASLSKEGQLIEDNTGALKRYVEQLKNSALAKMATDKFIQAKGDLDSWTESIGERGMEIIVNVGRWRDAVAQFGEDGARQMGFEMDAAGELMYDGLIKTMSEKEAEVKKWETKIGEYTKNDLQTKPNQADLGSKSGGSTKDIKDYHSEVEKLILATEQMKIDVLQEGRAKELAQINLAKQEQLDAITQKQKEIEKALAKGGLTKDQRDDLTQQKQVYESQKPIVEQKADQDTVKVNKKYDDEIADGWKALTEVFLTEEEKRTGVITDEYTKRRKRLDELSKGGSVSKDEYIKISLQIDASEEQEVNKSKLKEYEDFAKQYLDKANEFKNNLINLEDTLQRERENLIQAGASKGDLQQFDERAKKKIDSVNAIQAEMLTQLDEQIGVKNQTFISFIEGIANAGLDQLIVKLSEAEQLLAAAQLNNGGESAEKAGQYQAQIAILKQQIITLQKANNTKEDKTDPLKKHKATLKAVTELGKAAQDIAESFDGLDGNISDIMKSAGKLSSSIGSLLASIVTMSVASQTTVTTTSILGMVAITTVSTAAAASLKAVEGATVILAIIGAALQIITAIADALAGVFNDDKKHEAEIERLQGKIDALTKSYEVLEKAMEKAFSTDASDILDQQNQLIENQKKLIQLQIAEEAAKKDSDSGKIDDWKKQLEELDQKIEDNKEKKIEVRLGSDWESDIDSFVNYFMDSMGTAENGSKEFAENMKKNIVQELLKKDIGDAVTKMRSQVDKLMADGDLSDADMSEIDRLSEEVGKIMEQRGKAYEKAFGEQNEVENSQSLTGQIKGSVATEASVAELGGLFRSQTDSLLRIDNKLDLGFANIAELARSNAAIEANTLATANNTAQTVLALANGFSLMQTELSAINKNTSKDTGSYGS